MKSKIVSFESYVWLFPPDFPQSLLVETLYVSYINWNTFSRASLEKTCLHWAYFVIN